MKSNNDESMIKFYNALGHLFYAIAAADKSIRPKEIEAMQHIIKTDWSSDEALIDHEHSATGMHIQIAFHHLARRAISAKEAMAVFRTFKENNKRLFTQDVKTRIWKTVNTMAEAVAGKNKSELVLLSQLSALFKKE